MLSLSLQEINPNKSIIVTKSTQRIENTTFHGKAILALVASMCHYANKMFFLLKFNDFDIIGSMGNLAILQPS